MLVLQAAAEGPVVQEAVMALARAVQQLESRSLSHLEELKVQLRPSNVMLQRELSQASAAGEQTPQRETCKSARRSGVWYDSGLWFSQAAALTTAAHDLDSR